MAHLKSLLLLFVIACVNVTFGQESAAAVPDKEFEIKYLKKASWYNAHLSCLEFGGQLASIESQEEQDYVVGLISDLGLQGFHFWIAGTDLANERIFNWFTTGAPVRYTNFRKGEPNNMNGAEHCLMLRGDPSGTLPWIDYICTNLLFFVCEKKPKC